MGPFWIKLYRPLILDRALRQAPGSKGYGFAKEAFQGLSSLSPMDLRIGSVFHDPQAATMVLRAIRDACYTIIKMPAYFTTWPGSQQPLFEGDLASLRLRTEPAHLDIATLSRFGSFRVPTLLWDCLSRYACWLEPAINHEWVQLMQRYNSRDDTGLLHTALAWQESRRDTSEVRRLVGERLQQSAPLACVWTSSDLRRTRHAIDHCFPWVRWNNNDLWNLLPVTERANSAKSDRLPAATLMQQSRNRILEWWNIVQEEPDLARRFHDAARASLPLVDEHSSLPEIFEGVLHQRQRLKANQQLAKWMGVSG